MDTPPVAPEEIEAPDIIDYASVEFEVERLRKRLAVWEIFLDYMRDGAKTWPQVQQSLSAEDFDRIMTICDGIPLRDSCWTCGRDSSKGTTPRNRSLPRLTEQRRLLLATAKRIGRIGGRRCLAERRRPLLAAAGHLRTIGLSGVGEVNDDGGMIGGLLPLAGVAIPE